MEKKFRPNYLTLILILALVLVSAFALVGGSAGTFLSGITKGDMNQGTMQSQMGMQQPQVIMLVPEGYGEEYAKEIIVDSEDGEKEPAPIVKVNKKYIKNVTNMDWLQQSFSNQEDNSTNLNEEQTIVVEVTDSKNTDVGAIVSGDEDNDMVDGDVNVDVDASQDNDLVDNDGNINTEPSEETSEEPEPSEEPTSEPVVE